MYFLHFILAFPPWIWWFCPKASPSTELLRSTFSTLLPVLQTFTAITKLSGRKTKFFLVFFKWLLELPILNKLFIWSKILAHKRRRQGSRNVFYTFLSLICWAANLIHWSGFMQTLFSKSFCTKSWCIMYRVWKWMKLHLEIVWVAVLVFFKQAKNEQVLLLLLPFLTFLTRAITHGFCLLKAAFHTMFPVPFFLSKSLKCQKFSLKMWRVNETGSSQIPQLKQQIER